MSATDFWRMVESKKIKLPGTPAWEIMGYSQAARKTMLYCQQLHIAFDAGTECTQKPKIIFISHTHYDHICMLISLLLSYEIGETPIIVCPAGSMQYLKNWVAAGIIMTKNNSAKAHAFVASLNFVPAIIPKGMTHVTMPSLTDGSPYTIINKIRFKITLFKCNHSVPTTGYGFTEIRSRLKDEFKGLPQGELEEIKSRGIDITHEVELDHFCYLLDTDHEVLANPELEKFKTLITECTFWDPKDLKTAKQKKHMHFINLKPYVICHPEQTIIAVHMSAKHTDKEIDDMIKAECLPNLIPLIHSDHGTSGECESDDDCCCDT